MKAQVSNTLHETIFSKREKESSKLLHFQPKFSCMYNFKRILYYSVLRR